MYQNADPMSIDHARNVIRNMIGGETQNYSPHLARILEGRDEAILVAYFVRWAKPENDYWCWRTAQQIEYDTAIPPRTQQRVRISLMRSCVLEEKLVGVPARMHYRIDYQELLRLLAIAKPAPEPDDGGQSSLATVAKLDTPPWPNLTSQGGQTQPLNTTEEPTTPISPNGGTGGIRNNYPPDFEEFWQAYPKGHGSKKVSFDQWKKIGPIDRAVALDALDAWKRSERWTKDGGKYVKDCERYLSQRMYDNPPGDQHQQVTPLGQETDDQWRGRVPWYQKHPKTGDVIDVNKLPHNSGLRSVLTGVPIIG